MMKKIIVFMSLFFVSFPLMAICTMNGTDLAVRIPLKTVLTDTTLPAGTVLFTKTFGGNVASTTTFSGCAAGDVYSIAALGVTEAIGVKGVRGGTVYETGVPGIGFEFSELIAGSIRNPVPAKLGTVSAENLTYKPVEQMTVWFIKTKDNIDTSFLTPGARKDVEIRFGAGSPDDIAAYRLRARLFRLILEIGPLTYRTTSCEINPRGGSTINLQPIDLTLFKSIAQGAVTGKQKEFTLDITCPSSSVGLDHEYWFNAITDNSPTKDGVLLNAIDVLSGGAKNVGLIIKQGTKPIKFFDPRDYTLKVNTSQSLNFTADYFKVDNDIDVGAVRAMMEVVIQEK